MSVITFASSKGGSGKTAAAGCLAAFWRQKLGRKVAVIDADVEQHLSRWVAKAKKKGNALGDVTLIQCFDDSEIVKTIRDARAEHDDVLIDCAGAAQKLLVFAVGLADLVVIPAQPDEGDLVCAVRTAKIVQQATELTGREIPTRVLLNRLDMRTLVDQHAKGEAERHGLELFETTWASRVGFKEGRFNGGAPTIDDPSGAAARETAALAHEICGELSIPVPERKVA